MAEQESAIAEAVTELEVREERHREKLVRLEAKWKNKVKAVSDHFLYLNLTTRLDDDFPIGYDPRAATSALYPPPF